MLLTKLINPLPCAPPHRPTYKQRWRRRSDPGWLVRRAPHQAIGRFIPLINLRRRSSGAESDLREKTAARARRLHAEATTPRLKRYLVGGDYLGERLAGED